MKKNILMGLSIFIAGFFIAGILNSGSDGSENGGSGTGITGILNFGNRCSVCDSELNDCVVCEGGKCADCISEITSADLHICPDCKGDPTCGYCTKGVCESCKDSEGYASPLEKCTWCGGDGVCYACDGTGIRGNGKYARKCFSCDGKKECTYCDGEGERRALGDSKCYSCKGSQKCKHCEGDSILCEKCEDGKVACPNAGKCTACKGEGKACFACIKGTNSNNNNNNNSNNSFPNDSFWGDICNTCGGAKRIDCPNCVGGDCVNCAGDGEILYYGGLGDVKSYDCSYCRYGRCSYCDGKSEVDCPNCY